MKTRFRLLFMTVEQICYSSHIPRFEIYDWRTKSVSQSYAFLEKV